MPTWALNALTPLAAYAAGCFVAAYYLVRWRTGQDIRALGSGNPGARNAGRVLGNAGFVATLLIDAGKGALVVVGARTIAGADVVIGAAMVAVVAGHVWPAQLGFRGGKGAATAMGVLLAYDIGVGAVLAVVFAVLLALSRSLTTGGLAAFAIAPVVAAFYGKDVVAVVALAIIAGIVLLAHRTK